MPNVDPKTVSHGIFLGNGNGVTTESHNSVPKRPVRFTGEAPRDPCLKDPWVSPWCFWGEGREGLPLGKFLWVVLRRWGTAADDRHQQRAEVNIKCWDF